VDVFISYRRDDTAGRAGRLFDTLAGRLGTRNVFQDVTTIAPGAEFDRAISAAIEHCDTVLVVIGTEWATAAGPSGRRLDEADDYVRREVAAALSSDVPVVPVLVGSASMPVEDELPPDLKPLVHRQAVTIRDDSWHQDVDTLVRRLQREEVVADRRRRWRPIAIAVGAVLVVGAAIAAVLLLRDDGGGGAADLSAGITSAGLTGCPVPKASWREIQVAGDAAATVGAGDAQLLFTVRSAALDPDQNRLYLSVEVRNQSAPGGVSVPYYNQAFFRTVLVDGLSQGDADCLSVEGDPNLSAGQRAIGLVGYDLTEDPTSRPLVLELFSGDPDIRVT
jgi:hypothetical protein